MNRVYMAIYLPNLSDESLPAYYVGSTSKGIDSGYLGTPKSKEHGHWWRQNSSRHPEDFDLITLSEHSTRRDALVEERRVQEILNVVESERFINKALAVVNNKYGNSVTNEGRRKLSVAGIGNKNGVGNRGRSKSEEHKKAIAKARCKPVRCIDTGCEYSSTTEAGKAIGGSASRIGRVCKGFGTRASGCMWEYI